MKNQQEVIPQRDGDYYKYFSREFIDKVSIICFKIVRDKIGDHLEIQEEVTSETLLRLWEHRHKIDFYSGKVWSYIKKIAINYLADIGKRGLKNDNKIVEFRSPEVLPEKIELQNIEYDLLLDDLMAIISDPIDKIIIEKKIEGYETAKEIVPFLKKYGINDPSTVSKRLKEIKEKAKRKLIQGE